MKVVHVITSLKVGGAEMMLLRLLIHSAEGGVESSVVTLTDEGVVGERIQSLGIQLRNLGMKRGVPNPTAVLRLARWLRRDRPDIVHTWMYHANLVGGLAAKLAGNTPVVWGIHTNVLETAGTKRTTVWVAKAGARLSRWLPTRVVCVSQSSQDVHIQMGYASDRVVTVPNGIDIDDFAPDPDARRTLRGELMIPPVAPSIGLVARWHADKDHANFFSAAGMLIKDHPEVQFILCGDGITWTNDELALLIDTNGVRSQTHLLGPRDDISRLMTTLDVYTSSSSTESFPLVVGEAMATGVPCVVTDVGDCATIVGDTGRVVPKKDPQALAAAWREMIALPESDRLDLGKRARARVAEHFDIRNVVREYDNLYLDIVGRNGPRVRG